jgi:hypothetical protein
MPLTLADLKARVARLGRLEWGFAREVALQRGADDVLLFRRRKKCQAPARSGRGQPGQTAFSTGAVRGSAQKHPATNPRAPAYPASPRARAGAGPARVPFSSGERLHPLPAVPAPASLPIDLIRGSAWW